jgi:hypothetical protein
MSTGANGTQLVAVPTSGRVGGTIDITVCDPATGTEKIYRVVGTDVTPT